MKYVTSVLIENIKKGRPDLAAEFSEYALTKIAEEELANSAHKTVDYQTLGNLTSKCIDSMNKQVETTHEDQTDLLLGCLENDCEYSPEKIKEMTPRNKVDNWLKWNGIQGYTDDILDVVSAAYGIILEPDLNR